jgi:hypothetical protein
MKRSIVGESLICAWIVLVCYVFSVYKDVAPATGLVGRSLKVFFTYLSAAYLQ